jgi:hypothetical protein
LAAVEDRLYFDRTSFLSRIEEAGLFLPEDLWRELFFSGLGDLNFGFEGKLQVGCRFLGARTAQAAIVILWCVRNPDFFRKPREFVLDRIHLVVDQLESVIP